jgi:formylglycine-generating enzyme required for sulfatase activity
MNPASEDRRLGEYRLKELISENPRTLTWLAEQVSVARRVLVDELRPECSDQRDAFLADIRAKAAVEHPLIGSVYEAVAEPGQCFFAHELLPGSSLEERRNAGAALKPASLAHVLRRISEAQIQHETLGQPTSPLGLANVHLDEHDVLRLDNLAIAGSRLPDQSVRDIVRLGESLPALLAGGQPGETRMLTLLSWMRGEGLEAPLNWEQTRDLCLQIEQQLAEPQAPASPTKAASRARRKVPLALVMAVLGIALVSVAAIFLRTRPQAPAAPPRASLPDAILIPAGRHPTPDGTEEPLPAFRISAHEVTIGQYAEFIETLETLAKDRRERTFDHEDQPPEKTSHVPDDWDALLAAAKAGGRWNLRPVTLDSPVVGVDWWDCSAYAEWKHTRLATQEEWFAALRSDVKVPSAITPADWIPVTSETTDRTPRGVIGMAGSVCEWTRRPAPNPANPLGERKWVIIGGSYLKPGSNALTREWTNDRSLRRPDLGFRLVFEAD